jgi:hypothetical protein
MSNSTRLPGEPGPVVDPLSLLDEQTGPLQARHFVVRKRSSLAGGSDKKFCQAPEILRGGLSRHGWQTRVLE